MPRATAERSEGPPTDSVGQFIEDRDAGKAQVVPIGRCVAAAGPRAIRLVTGDGITKDNYRG